MMISYLTHQRLHLSLHLRLLHGARHLKSVYFFHHFGDAPLSSLLPETNCCQTLVPTTYRRDCVCDLRLVTISVALRWRASSQQAVCRRWCDQLGDGDSTTHFRVGYPKLWSGHPEGALWRGTEWSPAEWVVWIEGTMTWVSPKTIPNWNSTWIFEFVFGITMRKKSPIGNSGKSLIKVPSDVTNISMIKEKKKHKTNTKQNQNISFLMMVMQCFMGFLEIYVNPEGFYWDPQNTDSQ